MTLPTITDEQLAKRERRSSFVTRLFLLVGATLLGAVLVVVVVGVLLIRHQQVQSVKTNNETHANSIAIKTLAAQIKSCTDPNGSCFKEGQARTGAAVASINQSVLYAASCASDPTVDHTYTGIKACVLALAKAHQ